jgi:hypothetical protein
MIVNVTRVCKSSHTFWCTCFACSLYTYSRLATSADIWLASLNVTNHLYDTGFPCALTKQPMMSSWSLVNRMLIVVNDVDENIDVFITSLYSFR